MNRLCALIALLPMLSAGFLKATAADSLLSATNAPDEQIEVQSLSPKFRSTYDLETGKILATNGVRVVYRDATVTARSIQLDPTTGEVFAEGAVSLERGAQTWLGERLRYNFRTRSMDAESFKLGIKPVFFGGQRVVTLEPQGTNRVFALTNATVTTDDVSVPGYRVQAGTMIIREDRRLIARNATLYVGNTPVFWFPVYERYLVPHPARWILTPGYRSLYGVYMRASYEFDITTNAYAAIHLDPYSRRGIGLGPEITYDLDKIGKGSLSGYWIADQDPGKDPLTGEAIDPQRERISFSHQVTLRPGLTGTAVVRQQSDRWVTRDFFEDEYRRNPLPSTFFEMQQAWPDFTLNALARVQINDFFETVERLPDVRLSAHRQEIGQSGLYYEGENSVGWFQHRYATGALTNDYSAFRADSFHQLLFPKTLFGWLNITPRVGGRLTYYGDTRGDGWEYLDAQTRGVFNTGAEISFKASRVWPKVKNQFWDVDGLRHIIEPSINYAYTPEPNARPLELPQFDTLLPSLRPLPVTYPDFNSIDSIDSQNVLRLGVRNKIQTKRDGRVEDLIDWALITDWRLDPSPGQGRFSDIYSEADIKPKRWLTLNSEVRVDPIAALLRESQTSAIIQPSGDWSLAVVHRYTRDDPELGQGGNLLGTRLYLRFGENWGFRTSHYYEIREHLLQEQYYTVYRDLRSLTAAITFRVRESLNESADYTIAVWISLKAFPRFKMGHDAERPALLIGG